MGSNPAVSVNKVLLTHGHAHLFTYHLRLLWSYQTELTETVWPTKPKLFTI